MSDEHLNAGEFSEEMAEYLPTFLDETEEQLDDLVETLLVLEAELDNREALNESFRLIHSIKGSAGIMGLESITVLTHHLENRFEQFRSGHASLDESTMNLVLRCIDFLRECTLRLRRGQKLGSPAELLAEVKELEKRPDSETAENERQSIDPSELSTAPEKEELESNVPSDFGESVTQLSIQFREGLQLIDLKAQLILNRLSNLGDVKQTAPSIEQTESFESLSLFQIWIESEATEKELQNVSTVDGVEKVQVQRRGNVDEPVNSAVDEHVSSVSSDTDPESVKESPGEVTDADEIEAIDRADDIENEAPVDSPTSTGASDEVDEASLNAEGRGKLEEFQGTSVSSDSMESPAKESTVSSKRNSPEAPVKSSETMRVEIDRLDHLMNLAGELVVNRARFEQIASEVNPELRKTNMINRLREFSDSLRQTIIGMENAQNATDWSKQIKQLRSGVELLEEQSEIWNSGRDYVFQVGEAIDQLSRVSHGLRRGVLGTRMVPVAPLFNRFKRVVRDLSKDRGKQVNLVIQGEKTELDKRMIDELGDPLVHLVRNSIDHGLETGDVRRTAGKPEVGKIQLEASHRGNNIYIQISDDGQGINVDKIKSRIVQRELLSQSAADELTREQALDYIWHPGFSTADQITDVSGRGVGMDVVNERLESLNGTIHVESIPGEGTTFTIRLPLTLAIISSLLVRVRNTTFALPIDDVREIVSIGEKEIVTVLGNRTFDVRGEYIPLMNMDDLFYWNEIEEVESSESKSLAGANGSETRLPDTASIVGQGDLASRKKSQMQVVVLTAAGKTIGLLVDDFLGSQDLVIKSLSDNFISIRGMSGASILGDGRVCLMLEVGTVIDMALRSARETQVEE